MEKQYLRPEKKYIVPGDPSSAAFLVVLALLTKNSKLELNNVLLNPKELVFFLF